MKSIYLLTFLWMSLSISQAQQPLPLVTPASCSEPNGKIQLFPSADDLSIYTLTWHEGDENGPVLPASPGNPALLENLAPGTYSVVAKIVEPMDLRHPEDNILDPDTNDDTWLYYDPENLMIPDLIISKTALRKFQWDCINRTN